MSYVRHVLQTGEQIIAIGKLHWIIYTPAILLALLGLAVLLIVPATGGAGDFSGAIYVIAVLIFAAALIALGRAWFQQWITELAVTDRRVVYKTGFLRRHTVEMNMDKVETVDVDQSILGRMLGYGTIHVLGTGSGMEHLRRVAHPLELRSAIIAK